MTPPVVARCSRLEQVDERAAVLVIQEDGAPCHAARIDVEETVRERASGDA